MSDTLDTVFIILLNVITLGAFFIFLRSFIKLRERNHGLYIILFLSISDALAPILSIINFYIDLFKTNNSTDTTSTDVIGMLMIISLRFSIFWTSAFALYSYRIVKDVGNFHSLKFILKVLPTCLMASVYCNNLLFFSF